MCAKGFLYWLNICVALFGAGFFHVCVGGGFQCSQKWGVIKLHHSGKIVLLAWWLKKGGRKKKQWQINREEVKENRRKVVAGSVTAGFTRIYSRCFLSSPPCSPPAHLTLTQLLHHCLPVTCLCCGWLDRLREFAFSHHRPAECLRTGLFTDGQREALEILEVGSKAGGLLLLFFFLMI